MLLYETAHQMSTYWSGMGDGRGRGWGVGWLHGDQSWFPGFRAHTRILSNPFLSLVALVLSTLIALCNTRRTSQHSNLLNEQLLFITKCDRVVLQSATAILLQVGQVLLQSAIGITKCCKCYYKVRQVLQSAASVFLRVFITFSIPSRLPNYFSHAGWRTSTLENSCEGL